MLGEERLAFVNQSARGEGLTIVRWILWSNPSPADTVDDSDQSPALLLCVYIVYVAAGRRQLKPGRKEQHHPQDSRGRSHACGVQADRTDDLRQGASKLP